MSNSKSAPTGIAYSLVLAAMFAAATAQLSPVPAPEMSPFPGAPSPDGVDCFTYLVNLADCLTFVTGGSNLTKPDPGCCPELANLVDTEPVCLCQLLGNPGQVGLSVDVNRALKLPSVCNVTTPPVSCAVFGVPSDAPSGSEVPSPSPGGEEAASAGGNNESPSNLASKHHFLFGLAYLLFFHLFILIQNHMYLFLRFIVIDILITSFVCCS